MAIRKRILVVGAGVSGLTTAYWLKKHGFDPVIIDRAPSARPGADILNLFGPGFRVAEKMGPDVDQLLDSLGRAPDFQSGPVCRIRMETWAQNRVALVGDAAYCPSMLSGQGASLAMAGAYLLAGELKMSEGRPIPAFLAYESKMRSLVERKQAASLKVSLTPESRPAFWIRGRLAAWLGFPMVSINARSGLFTDGLELPEY